MNKEEVIDFLVKCGMWVKDGAIKKSDLPKVLALISEKKAKAALAAIVSSKYKEF